MSTEAVNAWQYFNTDELEATRFKVRSLGLNEMLAMSKSFYQERLRAQLKKDSFGLFEKGDKDRIDYIIRTQESWPKGEELSDLASEYMLTGEGVDKLCTYAIDRFNDSLRGDMPKILEKYKALSYADRLDLQRVVLGDFGAAMLQLINELSVGLGEDIAEDVEDVKKLTAGEAPLTEDSVK